MIKTKNRGSPVHLGTLDLSIVGIYAVVLLVLAQWVSRKKAGHQKDSLIGFSPILIGNRCRIGHHIL
jgi:hypothetical protein